MGDDKQLEIVTFDTLLDFHYRFGSIHPFQGGNGRVGRRIVPFIIEDDMKMYYVRRLHE